MNRALRSVLLGMAVLIFAVFTSVAEEPATGSMNPDVMPAVTQLNPDVRLVQFRSGASVEQLTGAAALAHLKNLIARHPKAFAASRANMAARGFIPTNTVFVERTFLPVSSRSSRKQSIYSLVQTSSEQNSDGEIVFWSYDGPGDTWQGTIYMNVYADAAASTWDGQIDTGTQDYPWNWVTQTWGNDGVPLEQQQASAPRPPGPPLPGMFSRAAAIQLAAYRPGHSNIYPVRINWYAWADCWRAGVIAGCTTAAAGCIRVRAGFPACFGLWCLGAQIGTGISCAVLNRY